MDLSSQIVNLNEYDLAGSAADFTATITALAERTRAEGHPGVLRYSFYVDADEGTAAATIVYADADAWLEHHRIAYGWPEMPALQATVRLRRLTFLGPFNQAMQDWIENAGIKVPVSHVPALASGFER